MPPIPDEQRSPYPLDHNSRDASAQKRNKSDATTRPHQRDGDRGSIDDTAIALDDWMSFSDLKQAGIVESWEALKNWQQDPRIRFPRGRLFGPNARRWNRQKEIEPWLASRPVERAAFDVADTDDNEHSGGDEAA
jgi:predicted DNA-binding transcriptional regulator AlpA